MKAQNPEGDSLQAQVYDEAYDYGSDPHLAHPELHVQLVEVVVDAASFAVARDLPPQVLEIGAGDGGMTEPLLARGFSVTATEVSRDAVDRLQRRFGGNPGFEAVHDPAEDAGTVERGPFSLILCASVLHHIPDYLGFVERVIDRHLAPGGTFVSIQDPLRYDTMSSFAHYADRGFYLAWRLGRGNWMRGLVSISHRATGRMVTDRPGDMVEYHVVRNGVDERALERVLTKRFRSCHLTPYWSNQSRTGQRLGRRFGLVNQFALVAADHTPSELP